MHSGMVWLKLASGFRGDAAYSKLLIYKRQASDDGS